MAASTRAMAAIGVTAMTKVHARRMRWAISTVSSSIFAPRLIEGPKRTNGTAPSRCDHSPGSDQDHWRRALNVTPHDRPAPHRATQGVGLDPTGGRLPAAYSDASMHRTSVPFRRAPAPTAVLFGGL